MHADSAPRILVVDDDPGIREVLCDYLGQHGYDATGAASAAEMDRAVARRAPDLIVLDWMLPNVSGIEVCRRVKADPATRAIPIIMLSARSDESDRVRGLETGADDFITKPFSPKELVARAAAVLRRVRPALAAQALDYGGLEMDLAAHRVKRDGRHLSLGPTEYRLLRHFLENPGRVFSRQQLLETVWPHSEEIELRTVDVHIRRLRLAIGEPDLIRTVRSAGYALDADGLR